MPLPIQPQFTFLSPCYLVYGDESNDQSTATIAFHLPPPSDAINVVTLKKRHFTRVEGTTFGLTITPNGGAPITYHAGSMLEVGPNAWGIIQPGKGGFGYELAMTDQGKDVNAAFNSPNPILIGPNSVLINDGSVNNGLSDDTLLEVTYKVLDGTPQTTAPPVPTGKDTGSLLTGEILSVTLSSAGKFATRWPAAEVFMSPGMSCVVIGTYAAASLAIMMDHQPVQIVALTNIIPG
jgi:hypothetical protein